MGVDELVEEPRLADAGFAHDRDELALPLAGLRRRLADLIHLAVPPHEAAEAAGARRLEPGADGGSSRQLEHLDRRGDALDGNGTEWAHLHEFLGEAQGLGGEPGGAGRGELLHPRRQVRRLPDRGVVHAQIAPHRADYHVARVEPDADLHLDAVDPPRVLGIALDGLVHAEGRIACAYRMVLVGERGAEERHDPIAHDLVHRALVAVHRLHHPLEDGIEDPPRLLRVPIGEQLRRPLHVGEEDRHLLALTLDGGLGGENALGQVPGCVGLGRTEADGGAGVAAGLVAGVIALPHSPQNFWPSGLMVPQRGHRLARPAPHSPQNFWPVAFSCPHPGQTVTDKLPYPPPTAAGAEDNSAVVLPEEVHAIARAES